MPSTVTPPFPQDRHIRKEVWEMSANCAGRRPSTDPIERFLEGQHQSPDNPNVLLDYCRQFLETYKIIETAEKMGDLPTASRQSHSSALPLLIEVMVHMVSQHSHDPASAQMLGGDIDTAIAEGVLGDLDNNEALMDMDPDLLENLAPSVEHDSVGAAHTVDVTPSRMGDEYPGSSQPADQAVPSPLGPSSSPLDWPTLDPDQWAALRPVATLLHQQRAETTKWSDQAHQHNDTVTRMTTSRRDISTILLEGLHQAAGTTHSQAELGTQLDALLNSSNHEQQLRKQVSKAVQEVEQSREKAVEEARKVLSASFESQTQTSKRRSDGISRNLEKSREAERATRTELDQERKNAQALARFIGAGQGKGFWQQGVHDKIMREIARLESEGTISSEVYQIMVRSQDEPGGEGPSK